LRKTIFHTDPKPTHQYICRKTKNNISIKLIWFLAVADYITPSTGGNFDQLAAVAPNLEFTTDTRVLTVVTSLFYNQSVETSPKAFETFTAIPAMPEFSSVSKQSLLSFLNATVATGDRQSRRVLSKKLRD
jgi:hypothetical protein